MRNYNTYLKAMEKGNDEKLFFLSKLDLKEFNKVIDFGCGKGDILKACDNGKITLIGIDHDPVMIEYAKNNVKNGIFYSKLTPDLIDNKTLVIFSSVLHEVEYFWNTLETMLKGTGCTVVVRDMRFTGSNDIITHEDLSKLIRNSHPKMLSDFVKIYGLTSNKDMYHWLLKYSYVDNWELEVKENYFSFDYSKLFKLGKIIYERNYTLEFKKSKVLKDFGIELKNGTHTQLIIKLD